MGSDLLRAGSPAVLTPRDPRRSAVGHSEDSRGDIAPRLSQSWRSLTRWGSADVSTGELMRKLLSVGVVVAVASGGVALADAPNAQIHACVMRATRGSSASWKHPADAANSEAAIAWSASGEAGPAGQDGIDGAPGRDGFDGAPGERGPQGPAGPNGDTGATGDIGPAGPRGQRGEAGPQGQDGESSAEFIGRNAFTLAATFGTAYPYVGVTGAIPPGKRFVVSSTTSTYYTDRNIPCDGTRTFALQGNINGAASPVRRPVLCEERTFRVRRRRRADDDHVRLSVSRYGVSFQGYLVDLA